MALGRADEGERSSPMIFPREKRGETLELTQVDTFIALGTTGETVSTASKRLSPRGRDSSARAVAPDVLGDSRRAFGMRFLRAAKEKVDAAREDDVVAKLETAIGRRPRREVMTRCDGGRRSNPGTARKLGHADSSSAVDRRAISTSWTE